MNVIYLTDGAVRKVKVGNRTITFKKATPKNVAAIGSISGLVIQALKTIGKLKASTEEIDKTRLSAWLKLPDRTNIVKNQIINYKRFFLFDYGYKFIL